MECISPVLPTTWYSVSVPLVAMLTVVTMPTPESIAAIVSKLLIYIASC
jgi:hypothetical protein